MNISQKNKKRLGISMGAWQNKRKRLIKHSDRVCGYCGLKIIRNSDITVDHIRPLKYGGKSGLDNLIVVCKTCNSSKGSSCDIAIISFWAYYWKLTKIKFYIITIKTLVFKG